MSSVATPQHFANAFVTRFAPTESREPIHWPVSFDRKHRAAIWPRVFRLSRRKTVFPSAQRRVDRRRQAALIEFSQGPSTVVVPTAS
jgi:hypothetical protein